MTLTNTAYLEIEASTNAVFEFNIGLEFSGQVTKSYLMGERGQYIREVVNQTPGTGSFDEGRRTGFWLDGGAGNWTETFSFETGTEGESVQWGDSSGGTGQSNVTEKDASGSEVAAVSRKNVLDYWLAQSKSDSGGDTRIHFGEWTNGNIAHITGVSAGAYGDPMNLAITEWQTNTDIREPGLLTGQISGAHADLWGGNEAPAWVSDAVGAAIDAAGFIPDA